MNHPRPGQRWLSTADASLGLGLIESADPARVTVRYPLVDRRLTYATANAPLVRARFAVGDEVGDRHGSRFLVEQVEERDGLLRYHGQGRTLAEDELLDSLGFARPDRRLLAGLVDPPADFELRLQALHAESLRRGSPARGFRGLRIDLIPHQLAIAAEAATRLHPRLLLADEVGLGKTIEACLVLHHLHHAGRADRVLVLVPEPLVHQWFVELLRRFNLRFAIYDEARCASLAIHDPDANPFLDAQLVLAPLGLLADDPRRLAQARDSAFDLLIVDEAHHLDDAAPSVSPAYRAVETLAAAIPSLLLLTATPRQLGAGGHFARLRLLDPARHPDLARYEAECAAHEPLARAVEALDAGELPAELDALVADSPQARERLAALRAGDESARPALRERLLDGFGTGRLFFRNTRKALRGFPERIPRLHPLAPGQSAHDWLADFLRRLPDSDKVLLITGSPEAAIATREELLQRLNLATALFHEDLGLLERDRNAAWFADPEGARILLCSEIGSEGRNFQFARHLVLFGLPRDPERVEQRIGRLDRIGRVDPVEIHLPYAPASRSERQVRWLHEGLDALSHPLEGASRLAEELLPELDAFDDPEVNPAEFDAFLARCRVRTREVADALAHGHDRLLTLAAPPAGRADALRRAIEAADRDLAFERFALRLLDRLGLDHSELAPRCHHLRRGQRASDAFAELRDEGLAVTFERSSALAREDLTFLGPDHFLLIGALEQLLAEGTGSSSFAVWKRGGEKGLLLEAAFVLETTAPARLQLDRFLPPRALVLRIDHRGETLAQGPPLRQLEVSDPRKLVAQPAFRQDWFPRLLQTARREAESRAGGIVEEARALAERQLDDQLARLRDLAERNPSVSTRELDERQRHRNDCLDALRHTRLRLDALRLVWCA